MFIIPKPIIEIELLNNVLNNGVLRQTLLLKISNVFKRGITEVAYNIFIDNDEDDDSEVIESEEGLSFSSKSETYTFEITGMNIRLFEVSATAIVKYQGDISDLTVAELTENTKFRRCNLVTSFKQDTCENAWLKAFTNIVRISDTVRNFEYYAAWEYSDDGINFKPCSLSETFDEVAVRVLKEKIELDEKIEDYVADNYETKYYVKFTAKSQEDYINKMSTDYDSTRIDILKIPFRVEDESNFVDRKTYRFSLISVSTIDSTDIAYAEGGASEQYKKDLTLGVSIYSPNFSDEFEFPYNTFGNTVAGKKLYYKKAIYSYGAKEFKNNIFPSDTGSFITPLFNVIDLDANEDNTVTALLPWRDYLIASTEKAMYLINKASDGYISKAITTSVGIPEEDSRTFKSILNGIVFKSGNKIYTLYPNHYSGDDSMLNVADLTTPIQDVLDKNRQGTEANFAISTDSFYYLFLPQLGDKTNCLIYDYSKRIWNFYEYPCIIYDYEIFDIDNIILFAYNESTGKKRYKELYFEKDFFDIFPDADKEIPYGDILSETESISKDVDSYATSNNTLTVTPISFKFDTGQKTDNLSLEKQFVETKIIAGVRGENSGINMSLDIFVNGNLYPHHLDINTDDAFQKTSERDMFTLTSEINSEGAEYENVLKQLFTRYSGRGKTIRHVLTGTSLYDFKLYETFYRYRILNVKQ